MRKIALVGGVLITMASVAACGNQTTPAAGPASSTATTPAASRAATTPATEVPTASTPSTDAPTASDPAADTPAADTAPTSKPTNEPAKFDWRKQLEPCRYKEQKADIQKVITKDVTGDGTAETIVVRSCTTTTAYWPSTVEIFDGASHNKIGVLLKEWGPTDSPWVTNTSIKGKKIVFSAAGLGPRSARACADYRFTYAYTWTGQRFLAGERSAAGDQGCARIS